MYLNRTRHSLLHKAIAAVVVCLFLANGLACADPAEFLNPPQSATLAPESRIDPFYKEHGIESASWFSSTMAAMKLRSLLDKRTGGQEILQEIGRLNLLFRKKNISLKIDLAIESPKFACSGRDYQRVTFHFGKEKKSFKVAFIDDDMELTDDELTELGVLKKDVHGNVTVDERRLLRTPGLRNVWFLSPRIPASAPLNVSSQPGNSNQVRNPWLAEYDVSPESDRHEQTDALLEKAHKGEGGLSVTEFDKDSGEASGLTNNMWGRLIKTLRGYIDDRDIFARIIELLPPSWIVSAGAMPLGFRLGHASARGIHLTYTGQYYGMAETLLHELGAYYGKSHGFNEAFASLLLSTADRETKIARLGKLSEENRLKEEGQKTVVDGERDLSDGGDGPRVSKPVTLKDTIRREIRDNGGQITFARFISICQSNYYARDEAPMGATAGAVDFVTWPEWQRDRFGVGLGQQIIEMWVNMGRPKRFSVVEMGAGRGTMAVSIMDYIKRTDKDMFNAMDYIIVEMSPSRIRDQKQLLGENGFSARWIETPAQSLSMTKTEGVFISNELCDDLPVHRVKMDRRTNKIREVYVAVSGDGFREVTGDISDPRIYEYLDMLRKARGSRYVDDCLEKNEIGVCVDMMDWQEHLSRSLDRGYVITIDYGNLRNLEWPSKKKPAVWLIPEAPLSKAYKDPAGYSITHNVDFLLLSGIGRRSGFVTEGIVPQEIFLNSLTAGISEAGHRVLESDQEFTYEGGLITMVQSKGLRHARLTGLARRRRGDLHKIECSEDLKYISYDEMLNSTSSGFPAECGLIVNSKKKLMQAAHFEMSYDKAGHLASTLGRVENMPDDPEFIEQVRMALAEALKNNEYDENREVAFRWQVSPGRVVVIIDNECDDISKVGKTTPAGQPSDISAEELMNEAGVCIGTRVVLGKDYPQKNGDADPKSAAIQIEKLATEVAEIRARARRALGEEPTPEQFKVIWQAHLEKAEGDTGSLGEPDDDGIYSHSTFLPETKRRKLRILTKSRLFIDDDGNIDYGMIRRLADYGAIGGDGKISPKDRRLLALINTLLHGNVAGGRASAANRLGTIFGEHVYKKRDTAAVIQALTGALKDQDMAVVGSAISSLSIFGPAAQEAIPNLRDLLKCDDNNIRDLAARCLARISPDAAAPGGPAVMATATPPASVLASVRTALYQNNDFGRVFLNHFTLFVSGITDDSARALCGEIERIRIDSYKETVYTANFTDLVAGVKSTNSVEMMDQIQKVAPPGSSVLIYGYNPYREGLYTVEDADKALLALRIITQKKDRNIIVFSHQEYDYSPFPERKRTGFPLKNVGNFVHFTGTEFTQYCPRMESTQPLNFGTASRSAAVETSIQPQGPAAAQEAKVPVSGVEREDLRFPARKNDLEIVINSPEDLKAREEAMKRLGSDTRYFGFTNPLRSVQFEAIRRVVNPDNEPGKIGIYLAAASDILGFLMTTDADEGYFVDIATVHEEEFAKYLTDAGWESLDENKDERLKKYAEDKLKGGYISTKKIWVEDIEKCILFELKKMGLSREAINISKAHGIVSVSFKWAYNGHASRLRTIHFYTADITTADGTSLCAELEGKVNTILLKAGLNLPYCYEKFLNRYAKTLINGGFLVTDNYFFFRKSYFTGYYFSEGLPIYGYSDPDNILREDKHYTFNRIQSREMGLMLDGFYNRVAAFSTLKGIRLIDDIEAGIGNGDREWGWFPALRDSYPPDIPRKNENCVYGFNLQIRQKCRKPAEQTGTITGTVTPAAAPGGSVATNASGLPQSGASPETDKDYRSDASIEVMRIAGNFRYMTYVVDAKGHKEIDAEIVEAGAGRIELRVGGIVEGYVKYSPSLYKTEPYLYIADITVEPRNRVTAGDHRLYKAVGYRLIQAVVRYNNIHRFKGVFLACRNDHAGANAFYMTMDQDRFEDRCGFVKERLQDGLNYRNWVLGGDKTGGFIKNIDGLVKSKTCDAEAPSNLTPDASLAAAPGGSVATVVVDRVAPNGPSPEGREEDEEALLDGIDADVTPIELNVLRNMVPLLRSPHVRMRMGAALKLDNIAYNARRNGDDRPDLLKIFEEAAPLLAANLDHPDAGVRGNNATPLGQLGAISGPYIPKLKELLNDPEPLVHNCAYNALYYLGVSEEELARIAPFAPAIASVPPAAAPESSAVAEASEPAPKDTSPGSTDKMLSPDDMFVINPTFHEVLREVISWPREMDKEWRRWIRRLTNISSPDLWNFPNEEVHEYAIRLSKMDRATLEKEALNYDQWKRGIRFCLEGIAEDNQKRYGLFHFINSVDPVIYYSEEDLKTRPPEFVSGYRALVLRGQKESAFIREVYYRWDDKPKPRSYHFFKAQPQGPAAVEATTPTAAPGGSAATEGPAWQKIVRMDGMLEECKRAKGVVPDGLVDLATDFIRVELGMDAAPKDIEAAFNTMATKEGNGGTEYCTDVSFWVVWLIYCGHTGILRNFTDAVRLDPGQVALQDEYLKLFPRFKELFMVDALPITDEVAYLLGNGLYVVATGNDISSMRGIIETSGTPSRVVPIFEQTGSGKEGSDPNSVKQSLGQTPSALLARLPGELFNSFPPAVEVLTAMCEAAGRSGVERRGDGRWAFVFSEGISFENGLGAVLPAIAEKGAKVAVVVSKDAARAEAERKIVTELNRELDKRSVSSAMHIQCIDDVLKAAAELDVTHSYYFRMDGEKDGFTQAGGVTPITVTAEAVARILAALGRVCGVPVAEVVRLEELRKAFIDIAA